MAVKINTRLLPIKAHFFFFMAAMGPILPQLSVYGKELGISTIVMGSVTGLLPIAYLLAKPLFGMIVDVYRNHRKMIFIMVILVMVICFALINLVPPQSRKQISFDEMEVVLEPCNVTTFEKEDCKNRSTKMVCQSRCLIQPVTLFMDPANSVNATIKLCHFGNDSPMPILNSSSVCNVTCTEDIESEDGCLYKTLTFWYFIIPMALGSIGFNVVNSISDAICFDVTGTDYDYGQQRVWGSIGFGLSALIAGYVVDLVSGSSISYAPAFVIMLICSLFDLFACIKLKLPIIKTPENLLKDMKELMNNRHVVAFITFAVFAGMLDSILIYYLFWYLEDLAESTKTTKVKLLEGLIVAAETLGGEVIFFSLAGSILNLIGHVHCFSMCFVNYALRLGLISVAPSPWWILPIEFVFQGPTYALTYTTIVEYANELAPPGASATMQGIAAGMDDGFGYALGSFLGGILYKFIGGKNTLQVFSLFGLLCGVSHLVLHKTIIKRREESSANSTAEYKSPEAALETTYGEVT